MISIENVKVAALLRDVVTGNKIVFLLILESEIP
jgi:hypothetical protein